MADAIKVNNLSKVYQTGQIGTGTISRDLERWFAKIRGKEDPFMKIGEENRRDVAGTSGVVWSLKDINFNIQQGEAVGIIGRNGAGKSTLLKILSRVTSPTTGLIKAKGHIASLLEVGTGFHPELTGKENIYLNGAILGMRKKEITRKLDEIISFSGVERYIDTPVKRYSSGMYVRLAFAVAAHLDAEILIVDEVLAVGDAEFQKKCLGKMGEVTRGEGRTVLFVSHDMNAIINLCSRAILLENGRLKLDSNINEVLNVYKKNSYEKKIRWDSKEDTGKAHFTFVEIDLEGEQPFHKLQVVFEIKATEIHNPLFAAFDICNSVGVAVMQAIPVSTPFIPYKNGTQKFVCEIELYGLIPDSYFVSAWIGEHNSHTIDWQRDILSFEILMSPIPGRTVPHSYANGFIIPPSKIINSSSEKVSD